MNDDAYWTATLTSIAPVACAQQTEMEMSLNRRFKWMMGIVFAFYALVFSTMVHADVTPAHPPVDTTVGGTHASELSLSRIAPLPYRVQTLQNLAGPNFGINRERDSIQVVAMTERELPGIPGYYMRSSYVVLLPRGFAPIHSHARRPAYLQVISGSIMQHRSDGLSLAMGPGDFTFSSDQLAHWWINQSTDTAIRLWIVELCTEAHGCKGPVEGGARVLTEQQTSSARSRSKNGRAKQLMSIDLAGEFPAATHITDEALRLRKVIIAPGESVAGTVSDGTPTYFRIAQGAITVGADAGASRLVQHDIAYMHSSSAGVQWFNQGKVDAVVFVVDLIDP